MNVTSSLSGNYHVCDVPALVIEKNNELTTLTLTLSQGEDQWTSEVLTYVSGLITYTDLCANIIFNLNWRDKPKGANYNFNVKLTEGEVIVNLPFVAYFPETFIQAPENNGLYFQKSVPDIIMERNDIYTSAIFELKKGTEVILTESYLYGADHKLRIRNIYEIIEKYFNSDSEISEPGTTNISTGLSLDFTINIITPGSHIIAFKVLKCDADITADAAEWTAANFLTRCYREKRTAKSRNEYLSFLMKNSYSTVTINYKVIYILDGVRTEIIGTLGTIAQQVGDNNVATFNASIHRIMVAAGLVNFTEVIQYDIWLTGTGLLTNVYTFLVDNTPYRNSKSFVFVNCFGVLETWTATGLAETKKAMEYNLGNIENHYRKITQDFYAEKQCNSGYLSEAEMDWIDDFIKSFSVINYSQDITQNEEITLISVDKTDTEANVLQAFLFNYRKAKNLHLAFMNAAKNISDYTLDQTFD